MPQTLIDRFIAEKQYITGVSDKTVKWYRESFRHFRGCGLETADKRPPASIVAAIKGRIAELNASGKVKPISINTWLRPVNTFLHWLETEQIIPDADLAQHRSLNSRFRLTVPRIKESKTIIQPLTPPQVEKLIKYRPRYTGGRRVHAIALICLDCGARIGEVLSIRRDDVDPDNFLLKLHGKGDKERLVPLSPEGRRIIMRQMLSHDYDIVFHNGRGCKLNHRNLRRDYHNLARKAGLGNVRAFHQLRHTFAISYLRSGGDVLSLQRIMGHESLEMTRKYVRETTEDLKQKHRQHGRLLAGLK
jgi:integrase/recombinase XerD